MRQKRTQKWTDTGPPQAYPALLPCEQRLLSTAISTLLSVESRVNDYFSVKVVL